MQSRSLSANGWPDLQGLLVILSQKIASDSVWNRCVHGDISETFALAQDFSDTAPEARRVSAATRLACHYASAE
jgi:hypothetical protein